MQVTIFAANCIGQAANCSYPNKVTVVTPEQLREAVKADHVCAEYKGNYRGIGNFIRSDVIVMDIDNDHSEEPAEWITAEKLEGIFPDMEYMLASSRHHLLPKEGKSARPRYHIYFPISEIADAEVYGNLKKALQKEYPFFDGNALDAARFIFGADCEEVLVHDGWMTIDEEIDVSQLAEEEDFDSEDSESASGGQILEGSRNNTMSRFAGRVLKRYGITEKAHEAFLEHAKKCDPPLPESEKSDLLMLVPGVSFDPAGRRIGYGGGFYDTYLQKMEGCHTFGLAFEVQMADQIPAEAHDIRMEYVMTEKRCWKC